MLAALCRDDGNILKLLSQNMYTAYSNLSAFLIQWERARDVMQNHCLPTCKQVREEQLCGANWSTCTSQK